LFLLNRQASYEWLGSMNNTEGVENAGIPTLTPEDHANILRTLKQREAFQPWTHRLVEGIGKSPLVRKRFPYQEYVQKVGRLEAQGWFVRVYVNLPGAGD